MTAPLTEPAPGSAALTLRLVARRHVDLRRVSSALCLRP
ncbi:putative leader peptide [Pseudonocardia aurantiaca]|uniref:Leader peptide n=1 Tax=Pseudonocardia aurantiaca TaxID=75290 RepID=A0ABW4FJU6_9PSEU